MPPPLVDLQIPNKIDEVLRKISYTNTFFFNVLEIQVQRVEITEFSTTQILREIKIVKSKGSKSAIFWHIYVEALKFDFYGFLHFLKAKIAQINRIQTF